MANILEAKVVRILFYTIKGAGTEARGLKGGLGGRGPRRWGEWKGISYPWTCAVAPRRSPGGRADGVMAVIGP
jgi:hypothetical protein